MLVTQSLRHCSNKYKLAREGEKEKDEDIEKVKEFFSFFFFFMIKSSKVERDEFSCCLKIDRDPPFRMGGGDHSRNGERECSGE